MFYTSSPSILSFSKSAENEPPGNGFRGFQPLRKAVWCSTLPVILFFASFFKVSSQEPVRDLFFAGEYRKVAELAAEALLAGDTAIDLFYFKALAEAQMGQTGKSVTTLEEALRYHSANPRIMRMLAGQYDRAGNYPGARELYLLLVRNDSCDLTSWLKLAEIAMFGQDYGSALEALQRVLFCDSLNLEGLMMTGEFLERKNKNEALLYYEKARKNYPGNQEAAAILGNLYIQEGRAGEAIPVFEYILDLDSTNIKFLKLNAYAYYKAGKPQDAVPLFNRAVTLGDSSAFTFKFLGIGQYLNASFPDAISSLRLAAEKDSMDAEIHFFLGASLAGTKDKERAMYHLQRSLELMRPDPSVISRIYSEQGNIKRLEMKYEEAYRLYEKAWMADTTQPMSLYYMASILDNSLHRSREALVDYQRFIEKLDKLPESTDYGKQIPTIREIVEDRIISLREELFFLDEH
jgi:tetratricopeptide (TPR) repeat protein